MIRNMYIGARGRDEENYAEPPARELNVAVVGGDAHLRVVELDPVAKRPVATSEIVVPAKSLLLALQAAVEDAKDAL